MLRRRTLRQRERETPCPKSLSEHGVKLGFEERATPLQSLHLHLNTPRAPWAARSSPGIPQNNQLPWVKWQGEGMVLFAVTTSRLHAPAVHPHFSATTSKISSSEWVLTQQARKFVFVIHRPTWCLSSDSMWRVTNTGASAKTLPETGKCLDSKKSGVDEFRQAVQTFLSTELGGKKPINFHFCC